MKSIRTIKILMLDYNGVTGKWLNELQIDNIAETYGLDRNFVAKFHDETGPYGQYEEGKKTFNEVHEELCRKSGRKIPLQKLFSTLEAIYKDSEEVVDYLKQLTQKNKNIKLVLAEDTGIEDLEWQKKNLESIKLFDYFFIAGELKTKKKNPEFFEKCFKELKAKPEEILFFDDKQRNIDAAKKVGINAFLYTDFEKFKEIINKNFK